MTSCVEVQLVCSSEQRATVLWSSASSLLYIENLRLFSWQTLKDPGIQYSRFGADHNRIQFEYLHAKYVLYNHRHKLEQAKRISSVGSTRV